jgi:hypothetical protein
MALLPYASRVTQTRGPKRDGERGRGRERDRDLPAPDTEVAAPSEYVEDEQVPTGVDGDGAAPVEEAVGASEDES